MGFLFDQAFGMITLMDSTETLVHELRETYVNQPDRVLSNITDEIVGKIRPKELLELKQTIGKERKGAHPQVLLAEAQETIERAQSNISSIDVQISGIRGDARAEAERANIFFQESGTVADNKNLSEMLHEQGNKSLKLAASLVDRTVVLEQQTHDLYQKIEESTDNVIEAAVDPKKDPKTDMATGRGLVEADVIRLSEIDNVAVERSRQDLMKNLVFVVKDMMLFHRGVIELGEEFDNRIKKYLAAGLISIAEFTAKGDEGLYWQMTEEDIKNDKALNLYFPEGSEIRKTLEEIKSLGIMIEPGRLNPGGGDEFITKFDLNVDRSEIVRQLRDETGTSVNPDERIVENRMEQERNRRLALAMEVVDQVIKNTTFSKDRPVMLDNAEKEYSLAEVSQRKNVYEMFYNHLNTLIPSVDEEAGISKQIVDIMFGFKDKLRSYFISSEGKYFTPGFGLLQPEVALRMDFAAVGSIFNFPTMEDFFEYANNADLLGKTKEEKDEYLSGLKKRLCRKLTIEDLRDERRFKEKVGDTIRKDILLKYYDFLFGEVNGKWKNRRKMDVMSLAGRGDSQAIFTVGSVRESGRDFAELNNRDRWIMWSNLIQYWVGEYDTEVNKKTSGGRYNHELVDGSFGRYIVGELKDKLMSQIPGRSTNLWSKLMSAPAEQRME